MTSTFSFFIHYYNSRFTAFTIRNNQQKMRRYSHCDMDSDLIFNICPRCHSNWTLFGTFCWQMRRGRSVDPTIIKYFFTCHDNIFHDTEILKLFGTTKNI